MFVKVRNESSEMQILSCLNARMELPESIHQYYFNLQKGYEGEKLFDLLIEKLEANILVLNDLLLQVNNTTFQIDSLIITSDTIYLFEVKNYQGDFYYDSDKIYTKSHSEIVNPLNQLNRSESLLQQLLRNLRLAMPIKSFVIFVHPEFTLYQSPMNKPFIFPTQLNRFLKALETTSSKLSRKHYELAEKLLSLHIPDSPFSKVPSYNYEQLRKGIVCEKCSSFVDLAEERYCICSRCGHSELVLSSILRSIKEFQLLFPNEKITTNRIFDWIKVISSKKRIQRVLDKHFNKVGVRQWTYYEDKDNL